MGTKNNPGNFDCYTNAEPDEPMFVLLARDEKAPAIVREWIAARQRTRGIPELLPIAADAKELEALKCADAMEKWFRERGK